MFRVLEEDANQQTIETINQGAMWHVTSRYRVQAGRIVPLSQREVDGLYAIALFVGAAWIALRFSHWVHRRYFVRKPAGG